MLANDTHLEMFRHDQKFTTRNDGISVTIRGSPGGIWYKKANTMRDIVVSPASVHSFKLSTPLAPRRPKSSSRSTGPRRSDNSYGYPAPSDTVRSSAQQSYYKPAPYPGRQTQDNGIVMGIIIAGAAVLIGLVLFGR